MDKVTPIQRLPDQEQVYNRKRLVEKPLTFPALKAMRDRLKEVSDSCEAMSRVLDQVETVLRQDELQDMPRFLRVLSHEFREKLNQIHQQACDRLENLKQRINR